MYFMMKSCLHVVIYFLRPPERNYAIFVSFITGQYRFRKIPWKCRNSAETAKFGGSALFCVPLWSLVIGNPKVVITLLCDFRRRPANTSAAKRCDQSKLVARGKVSTAVAGAVGHQHANGHQPTEVGIRRAERVASKKGYCEICRVHYNDMKLVRSLISFIFFAFNTDPIHGPPVSGEQSSEVRSSIQ